MVSSLTAQLRDTRQELREKEKEKKEADRAWQNIREDRDTEERKLRKSLEKRDKLIEVKCRNPHCSYVIRESLCYFDTDLNSTTTKLHIFFLLIIIS